MKSLFLQFDVTVLKQNTKLVACTCICVLYTLVLNFVSVSYILVVKVLLLLNYLTVYKRKTEPSKYELQYRSGENRDDVSLSTVLAL